MTVFLYNPKKINAIPYFKRGGGGWPDFCFLPMEGLDPQRDRPRIAQGGGADASR